MLPNVAVITNTDITPFTADIPESELDDLRARVANTRWAATLPGTGRGIAPAELKALADYWVTGFDWREAEAHGKPFADHATHLLVHAILHLAGYDHIDDQDAETMEDAERSILGKLGIPDPYLEMET